MIEWLAVDEIVLKFERAWQAGDVPSIHSFLRTELQPPLKELLLQELIGTDLEFRWKRSAHDPSGTRVVEDYVRAFPEVSQVAAIEEEYRARTLWGDSPDHQAYLQRFPEAAAEISVVLARVDEELEREQPIVKLPTLPASGRASPMRSMERGTPFLRYDDYLLREMVGFGQMGRVYRATQVSTSQQMAVKFLRKSFQRDEAAVGRFLREARLVSGLRHEGIVRVEGVGDTPGGGYFIVMEFLPGPDLSAAAAEGQISISDAVEWTIQAADAIESSHATGIIHCDLKPGNLVLDGKRNVRVTDFGLARSIDENSSTLSGIAGTAPYMAPEQVSAWWGSIGPRTDVYGLGAVLYTLLTGRPPYDGTRVTDVLSRVVSGVQPPPAEATRPSIGPALAAIVAKCLSKDFKDRYRSAAELSAALKTAAPS